jgi:hypothetical protein
MSRPYAKGIPNLICELGRLSDAPLVREAARLRLAFLADPAVRRLAKIIKHGSDAQALAAIKVVLDRNELYGFGVEHEAPAQVIAVQTYVNVPEVHLASMSDDELAKYR